MKPLFIILIRRININELATFIIIKMRVCERAHVHVIPLTRYESSCLIVLFITIIIRSPLNRAFISLSRIT